ncbi:MAG: cytochrome-c peroxidase [Planctomycetaceae bacterium]|nr:cytochrome-c peroxidase [Planctomycetaceae bacterium]
MKEIDPDATKPVEVTPGPEETVLLGSDELYDGIPGDGELTIEQIETWLADGKNHAVLKPELPQGLAAGAAQIQGLEENPLTRAKIELGRQLYFDPRLSHDKSISCASCHAPEFGYAFNSQFGIGIGDQTGNRNSPVAFNRILSGKQFWDGRADSLEAQAVGPIENPIEMGNTHEACVASLKTIPGYVKQFVTIFPEEGLTIETVGKAIAAFERTLVTGPAPWDYAQELKAFEEAYPDDVDPEFLDEFKEEDPELYGEYMALKDAAAANPMSESAARGAEIFFTDKGSCTACHVGVNFTDEKYHNLGVGMDAEEPDLGRFVETNVDADRGAFKTPTCRNVAMTAPYMHDGSQATLEEVVDWYAKGGHPNEWLSKDIRKLELTDQDKADLVAFMKEGLQSDLPKVESGRLPADP